MNKHLIIGLFLISAMIMLSSLSLAETAEMKDTGIDYVSYREIVVNEPGVVYQIKITNFANEERYYEIIPDSEIIRSIGTYRLDPSDELTLAPNAQETVYLYLAVEKPVSDRTSIPVMIKSGLSETTIELVARPIGPLMQAQPQVDARTKVITTVFKIIIAVILVIIIVVAIILGFRRIRKKKGEETEEGLKPEFEEEEIDTYY